MVQYPIPVDTGILQLVQGKTLDDICTSKEHFRHLAGSSRAFSDLLGALEKEALDRGCRYATGLAGGPCRLCDQCVGQGSKEPCRHAYRARPSMEALGIDVYQTAKNAGLPFEIPARDRPVWTGLLLVDRPERRPAGAGGEKSQAPSNGLEPLTL